MITTMNLLSILTIEVHHVEFGISQTKTGRVTYRVLLLSLQKRWKMKLTEEMLKLIPDVIPYPFDYDAPWVRHNQKGWKCDKCGISLKDNHEMLHTHHANGINRNTLRHLQALCIGCHAEQPCKNHCQLKQKRTYKRFMERYGKE